MKGNPWSSTHRWSMGPSPRPSSSSTSRSVRAQRTTRVYACSMQHGIQRVTALMQMYSRYA